jgi:ankyrin repeat protein
MNHKMLISVSTCFILSLVSGLSVSSVTGDEPGTNTEAERHYEKAYELRKATDYDAAIAEYEKVIRLAPNSKIGQDAQYWIGQSYLESKRFDAALSAFQSLLDTYPTSSIAPSTKQMMERVRQAKKNRALFEAVKKGDTEQVKLLLAEGADIDAKWVDVNTKEEEKKAGAHEANNTPLCYAVISNNMDLVKFLVEAGADVNAGSWPPLGQAVDKNNTAIAEYLIDHGANANYPKDWGPLHEAPYVSNNIEMVKLLVARGADINAGPWPALTVSIWEERKDIFDLLIQRGADVNTTDKWGWTPLSWAVDHDNLDSLKSLIAHGAKVDTKIWGGETALMSEASKGRTEAVKLLLEAGADIHAMDDTGQTALHRMMDVIHLPSKDMAELLLAKGAEVNSKDKCGRTPLHLAAESADADIVKLLLDKGAKVDEKDDESGFTPLHHAARFGKIDVAELLIARGADINTKDKQGHTPLQVAVNHDYKVVELLLNKGADSGIRTESGKTLLQLAQQRKQIESTAPDLIFDGEPNSSFGFQIVCGDVDGDAYDDILIGGHAHNNVRGRVYLFYGGPVMDTTADLILEGQNEGDCFGAWVVCGDIDNDGYADIVVGAGQYSERRGRAYLYWGSDCNSMDANPDKIFDGEAEEDSQFGVGNHAIYDIDNDGYNDIILGAPHPGASRDRAGRAYLYYGNTKELMDTSPDLIFTGEKPRDWFGYTIGCGDVDNDGYGDIVIGGWARRGRALLYYGANKSNMDAKADVVFEVESERFGCGIVCFDQNRDGYDDVVIGAPGYNHRQGRAYLYYGDSKRSMNIDPDMVFDGEVEGSYGLGPVQVVCGDIDGDNVNDIIIGANRFRQRTGRAYVYWGKDLSTPDPKPGRILTGENPNDTFGFGSACGDVNNDGFDDLVVGAHYYKGGAKQGRAYLYYGGPRNK